MRVQFRIIGASLAFTAWCGGVAGAQTRALTAPRLVPASSTRSASAAVSRTWTTALVDRTGRWPSNERLLAVGVDGQIYATIDGDAESVRLPEALDLALRRGEVHVSLVHNHPASVGLSGDDLRQLAKPGVDAVVALGHDGSVYTARMAGHAGLESALDAYADLVRTLADRLTHEARRDGLDLRDLYPVIPHLAASVLARAGLIEYDLQSSLALRLTLNRHRETFDRAVDTLSPNPKP